MNGPHLNDNQLQEYLDRNISDSDPTVRHLRDCPHCQKTLAAYQALYLALETEPATSLSPDFAQRVLDRIATDSKPAIAAVASVSGNKARNRWQVRDSILILAVVAVMIIVTSYFVDIEVLIRPFISWVGSAQSADAGWLATARNHARDIKLNHSLLLFSALTIIVIGLIDHLITRFRHHKPMTFMI